MELHDLHVALIFFLLFTFSLMSTMNGNRYWNLKMQTAFQKTRKKPFSKHCLRLRLQRHLLNLGTPRGLLARKGDYRRTWGSRIIWASSWELFFKKVRKRNTGKRRTRAPWLYNFLEVIGERRDLWRCKSNFKGETTAGDLKIPSKGLPHEDLFETG